MYNFERYTNHSKSRDIAIKQIDKLNENVKKLHEIKKYPMNELAFFEECAKEIIACRQVLKWTYVTDFYARDLQEHEKNLFKFQQGELENTCEQVHMLLESDLNKFLDISNTDHSPFWIFKSEVVNAMMILRKSFKTLIQETMENPKFAELGMDKDLNKG